MVRNDDDDDHDYEFDLRGKRVGFGGLIIARPKFASVCLF